MTQTKMSMAEALRDAMRVAMHSDPTVFLLGEDIGVSGGFGGGFTVTLGLSDEFGHERVMDTPIAETAIVGASGNDDAGRGSGSAYIFAPEPATLWLLALAGAALLKRRRRATM